MINKVIILLTLASVLRAYAQQDKPVVVLELFTSQGCSSCPPADNLLKDIKSNYENEEVYVLSYHVDYWNRLGWRDPFSKAAYSAYQRQYARNFNASSVYTPQLVVNGRIHFTGSQKNKALGTINEFLQDLPSDSGHIKNVMFDSKGLDVSYSIEAKEANQFTFVLFAHEKKTHISRGENSNKTIVNVNVVAAMDITEKQEGMIYLTLPDWVTATDTLSSVAFLKNKDQHIIGGTLYKL